MPRPVGHDDLPAFLGQALLGDEVAIPAECASLRTPVHEDNARAAVAPSGDVEGVCSHVVFHFFLSVVGEYFNYLNAVWQLPHRVVALRMAGSRAL